MIYFIGMFSAWVLLNGIALIFMRGAKKGNEGLDREANQ